MQKNLRDRKVLWPHRLCKADRFTILRTALAQLNWNRVALRTVQVSSDAVQDFTWIDALSESNLCVPLALPVSEQFWTQSTGKASGTHGNGKLSHGFADRCKFLGRGRVGPFCCVENRKTS